MTCLLNVYRKLKGKWGEVWQEHVRDDSLHNAIPTKFLEEVRECWEQTGEYLRLLDGRHPFLHYRDLAAAHISQAVKYPDLAEEALKDDVQRERLEEGLQGPRSRLVAASMHLYIDRTPLVVEFIKGKGVDNSRLVEDAWWTLIFRAMLWHRGHYSLTGKTRGYGGIPVPSSFWVNRLPVYIA